MSAIELTAAQIARVHADRDEVYDKIAASTITVGQVVYLTTAGKAAPADASVTTTAQVRGIALNNAAAGQVVRVLPSQHSPTKTAFTCRIPQAH
jgi:flagella basal body P-ring formation protein FlgA